MENNPEQHKLKDGICFMLIGFAALFVCALIAPKAMNKYQNTDFIYADIIKIYYTDDDDSVWDEYRYGYTQHTVVTYPSGEQPITKEVSALNHEWKIGQQLKLFEEGNVLRPASGIWVNTFACGGFGLCCITAGISTLIRIPIHHKKF